jgi:DNA modification methylase
MKNLTTESDVFIKDFPIDTNEISQEELNIEKKHRSNLFPWNGQFSPQLIETLLKKYSSSKTKVFDPFMGSGTVLVESAGMNLSAFGSEINPAAFQFSSIYKLCNKTLEERKSYIKELESTINDIGYSFLPLTNISIDNNLTIEELLNKKLLSLNSSIEAFEIFKTLLILLDYKTKTLTAKKFQDSWKKLKDVLLHLPYTKKKIITLNCDARATKLKRECVDLVITSPPYINVFNYHQQYRATTEEFGCNLLKVAKSEIGSNRKFRGNRFLTVIQYILDMSQVFEEIHRVCNKDARIIFVVGRESNVRKTKFKNSEIIMSIATQSKLFKLILRQERVFKNRFGESIIEDILHFIPNKNKDIQKPYEIALEVLLDAKKRVSKESKADLEDAISHIYEVDSSPLFNS